jgi:hypothetical protein
MKIISTIANTPTMREKEFDRLLLESKLNLQLATIYMKWAILTFNLSGSIMTKAIIIKKAVDYDSQNIKEGTEYS